MSCPKCDKSKKRGWTAGLWTGVAALTALTAVAAFAAATAASGGTVLGLSAAAGSHLTMFGSMGAIQGASTALRNPGGDDSYSDTVCSLYDQCQVANKQYEIINGLIQKIAQNQEVANADQTTLSDLVNTFTDMKEKLKKEKQKFYTDFSVYSIVMITIIIIATVIYKL